MSRSAAQGNIERQLFEKVLEHQLPKVRGQQRTDSTQIVGAIRSLNRSERVVETLRYALNALAVAAPEWTCAHNQEEMGRALWRPCQ